MAPPTFVPGLAAKIKTSYNAALKSRALVFIETEEEEVIELDIPFEIRFAPSLAKKPKVEGEPTEATKQADPFAPPYVPELFVVEDVLKDGGDEDAFVVLLNKFCVTPRHFLLVTKEFVSQNSPLTPPELLAAFSILRQLGSREKHLAFFNCGTASGASQPHKHIQFIPVSNGVSPFDEIIAAHKPEKSNSPFQLPLPYSNFTCMLSPPASADLGYYLAANWLALFDLMIDHLRRLNHADPNSAPIRLSSLSYNVIITDSYLHLVPRTKEYYETAGGEKISVNSLGFAGTLLVKSKEALEAVKEVGVLAVLESVGFPAVSEGDAPPEAELIL